MLQLLCLIWTLGFQIGASVSSISVSVSQPTIYAGELSTIQLRCEFSRSPVYVLWYYSSYAGASDRDTLTRCYHALGLCNPGERFANWTNLRGGSNGSLAIVGAVRQQGGYYECEGIDGLDEAKGGMRLFVAASGSAPSVTVTPSEPAAGDSVTLTCAVTGWNPPVNLTWSKTPPGYASPVTIRSGVDFSPPTVKFGQSTSRLSVKLNAADDRAVWTCRSDQPGTGETGAGQLLLRVEHAPTLRPVSDIAAIEGSSVSVTCQASGYPSPSIQLLASNGTVLQEWTPSSGADSGSTVSATFPLPTSDAVLHRGQSGSYACAASNSRGNASNPASFALSVLYPPAAKAPSSVIVNQGDPIFVECDVSGNPLPVGVLWRHPASGQTVKNVTGTGLHLPRALRQHTGEWRCEVDAVLATTAGERLAFSATASVQLTVRYAPGAPSADSAPTRVLAGSGVNVTCRVNAESPGEPRPELRWLRAGEAEVEPPAGKRHEPQLELQRVALTDSGLYTCRAWNSLGSSESQPMSLQVVQSPQAVTADGEVRARQGDDGFVGLVCRIAANPQPMIRWWRRELTGDRPMSLLATESGPVYAAQYEISADAFRYSSTLKFRGSQRYSVQLNDTGEYICEAVNELGALQLVFQLVVEVPPTITTPLSKVALGSKSSSSITCAFISHQPVSINWIDSTGRQLPGNASATNDSLPWQLISHYPNRKNLSLGNYTCRLNNSLGTVEQVFLAISTSIPDAPLKVAVRTQSWDRLLLTWTPGFDGGLPTRLLVLCRGWNATASGIVSFELTANASLGELELSGLHPDTTYSISVTPVNELGKGAAYEGAGAPLIATTAHLRLPVLHQPRWNRETGVLAFQIGEGDCTAEGCYCARLQASEDSGDTWRTVLSCSPLAKSGAETHLKLSNSVELYRVSLCLKTRPEVCGVPYTTYAVSSQLANVSTAVIILVTCACTGVVATLSLALVCLCVRKCGSGSQSQTQAKRATNERAEQNMHQLVSSNISKPEAEPEATSSATIRRQRQQLEKFVCSNSTDRSSNQTQETCLDSGSFSCTNGSSASPVLQLQLQQQLYSFGQHQPHQVSYCSDVTDSGCYFSSSVSPPPGPRRVIYEVVV